MLHDQIRDDLRSTFRGTLSFDAATRAVYATDASPFQVTPLGVAIPVDEADLIALVTYAHEAGVAIVPRGAGTGLAGESLGPGLIVDLSVHFREIVNISGDRVTVRPGVTHAGLNAALAKHGRRFAPDPASSAACTVGGMVATNASGGNAIKFGYTRDHAVGLRIVWDTGAVDALGHFGPTAIRGAPPSSRLVELRSQTAALLAEHRDVIRTHRPVTRFNRCGYVLAEVLTAAGLDLTKLLVGSEGTLGIVTEATLRTIPLAGGTCRAVLGFPSVDAAIRGGLALRPTDGIVGCDLLDQRLVALARAGGPDLAGLVLPAAVAAALIVTFEAETEAAAERDGLAAVASLRYGHRLLVLAEPTCQPDGVARVHRFRTAAVGGLYALGHGPRPIACAEDVAVPPEDLTRFLAVVRDILRESDLTASVLAHVLAGQVHVRPFADLADPTDRAKLYQFADRVHKAALAVGGTVSSQHGTGIARTPWVARQYGPLVPVFQELKRIFDPKQLLNPGKIVGLDPSRPAWPFRGDHPTSQPLPPSRAPLLVWPLDDPARMAGACNGCGDCRTRTTTERMCPVFHATGEETASPRAKANLLRQLLAPGADPTTADARAVADLCVNCKMCRDECRGRVDVPKLMLEAKAIHQAEHGLDRADWVLARIEGFAALAGNFSVTANTLLGHRPTRWVIEKLFGISRQRMLPALTHRTFLRRAKRIGLTRRGRRATITPEPRPLRFAYFVDTFANQFDPLIGEAVVAVLEHHGCEVFVPRRQRGSGMAPLAQGDIETARDIAADNIKTLAALVRDGYTIVCSEPTAALALTQDYLDLLDDPDAKLVADHTVELTTLLGEWQVQGKLRTDFRPLDLTLGHHVPCHLKALRGPTSGPGLLRLIPGVRVRTIDVSCSGMAGTWGLRADRYADSLRAGKPMLDEVNRPGVIYGSTECGACRVQMQDGTGKRTLHPVQYLAYAYGLLPAVGPLLARPLAPLLTS